MDTGQHVITGDQVAAQMEMRLRWLTWLGTKFARLRLNFWCDGDGEWSAWRDSGSAERSVSESAPDPHTLAARLQEISGPETRREIGPGAYARADQPVRYAPVPVISRTPSGHLGGWLPEAVATRPQPRII